MASTTLVAHRSDLRQWPYRCSVGPPRVGGGQCAGGDAWLSGFGFEVVAYAGRRRVSKTGVSYVLEQMGRCAGGDAGLGRQ